MRYHWQHLVYPEALAAFPNNPAIAHHVAANGYSVAHDLDVARELEDPRMQLLLRALFETVCDDYRVAARSLGNPAEPVSQVTPVDLVRQGNGIHLPTVEAAFEDLLERGVIAVDDETGERTWGVRAHELSSYLTACVLPPVGEDTRLWPRAVGA